MQYINRINFGPGLSLFIKRVGFIWQKLIVPISADQDEQRRELIFNNILAGSILLLCIGNISILYSEIQMKQGYTGVSLSAFFVFTLFFVSLFWLSRKGHYLLSSYILVSLYFLGITYACYQWGPSLPTALLSFALLIIISSIVIGSGFGVIVGIASCLVICILGYLELRHNIFPDMRWRHHHFKMHDAIEYSVILLLIMGVSWLSNKEINASLKRAKDTEKQLMQERDLLGQRVEERTREIKQVQLEKMAQLYRFAEFGKLSEGLFHDVVNRLSVFTVYVDQLGVNQKNEVAVAGSQLEKARIATKRLEQFVQQAKRQMQNSSSDDKHYQPAVEIEEIIQLLGQRVEKNNHVIVFNCPKDEWLLGNPLKFHQIVTNLLFNALESYEGSDRERVKPVLITLDTVQEDGVDYLRLEIIDHGCGIPTEIANKIFDPFFTTKKEGQGSGIGLASTKDIIEKDFQGTINVNSVQGSGSVFVVKLPLHAKTGAKDKVTGVL